MKNFKIIRQIELSVCAILLVILINSSPLFSQDDDRSLDIAYNYLNTGKTNEAITIFENHLKSNPDDMQINLQLAYAYKQIGENEKAIDYFKYVSTKSSDSKEITIANTEIENLKLNKQVNVSVTDNELEKGYAYINDKNYTKAIEIFENYKLKHPDNSKINLQLGYLYSEQKSYDKALDCFENVESNSKSPEEVEKAAQSKYYLTEIVTRNSSKSMSIYFYNLYDTYYQNYISSFIGHLNFKLVKNTYTGLYVDGNMDSRSKSGNIYNDRYFETGGFFKYMLNDNLGFELRAGFVREIDFNKNSFNFKPIVFAGTRFGDPAYFSGSKSIKSEFLYLDVFSMGLYDYKFRNVFGQLQLKEVLRTMTGGYSYLEFYLNQSLFADSKKFDYNNYAEIGAGINFKPNLMNFPVLFLEATNKFFIIGQEGQYFQGPAKSTFQVKAGFLLNFNSKL